MRRQRRRYITPIAVLAGLFGLGAASANAAGRVTAADGESAAVAQAAAAPSDPSMKLIASYSGDTEFNGPRITVPNSDYEAIVSYKCDDDGFLYVSWNGTPYSYEEAHSSAGKGTVVLAGREGGSKGYFAIDTWLGCSWSLKVYS
ncbi:hypothetical protein [Winogradskya humida]|uniref:Secreted protein n=1 Tax=Winogradskya humida TaxID=113566 RepID=A0ABQ3ZGH2_9ACTN|nr:hypothetical protein [Actinoplanes humidus]GIE17676.1 hypothetical protein Ahu01nite_007780 [Actinoplanes humidus]